MRCRGSEPRRSRFSSPSSREEKRREEEHVGTGKTRHRQEKRERERKRGAGETFVRPDARLFPPRGEEATYFPSHTKPTYFFRGNGDFRIYFVHISYMEKCFEFFFFCKGWRVVFLHCSRSSESCLLAPPPVCSIDRARVTQQLVRRKSLSFGVGNLLAGSAVHLPLLCSHLVSTLSLTLSPAHASLASTWPLWHQLRPLLLLLRGFVVVRASILRLFQEAARVRFRGVLRPWRRCPCEGPAGWLQPGRPQHLRSLRPGEAQEARGNGPEGEDGGPRHGKGEVEVTLPRVQRLRGPPLPLTPPAPLSLLLQVSAPQAGAELLQGPGPPPEPLAEPVP